MTFIKGFLVSQKTVKVFLALIVALISVIPQIWAYLRTPPGYFFTGINVNYNIADIQGVYFAAIRNFSLGDILYRNPFGPPQAGFFHYPVYLILGKIVQVTRLPVELVYHGAAFLVTFIFLLFIFKFLEIFFSDFRKQVLAFGLVSFGGLSFTIIPEGIGLFSYSIPHFVVAQLALFWCLYLFILLSINKKASPVIYLQLFLSTTILSAVHPWMVMPLGISFLIWLIFLHITKRESKGVFAGLVILGVTALPFLVYWGHLARVPWSSYPLVSSPFLLIALYGILLPVAAAGVIRVLAGAENLPFLFLSIWFLVDIVFVYLPFAFQRRFVEGLYFPLAVLAVVGVDWLIGRFHLKKSINLVYSQAFIYLSGGVIAVYISLFSWLPNGLVYRPVEEREAVVFLSQNSNSSQKVLSLDSSGNFVASRANVKIFLGHGIQTVDVEKKLEMVSAYFGGKLTAKEREGFIFDENICFVYVGTPERRMAKIDFASEDYLADFFKSGPVAIYKTKWCL